VKAITWDTVREIGLKLPNTTTGTAWRSPTLEVNGRRFAGVPVHKSAEPDSFAIHCDFTDRDALIAEQPHIYYTAAHYENYPCVLVRLSRINRDAIEDLLRMAHRYVNSKPSRRQSTESRARRPTRNGKPRHVAKPVMRDFDAMALYEAMETKRSERGLSWRQVANEIWDQSASLNRKRHDHPISPSTLTGIARRRDCTCQHALFILRWLERSPESFIPACDTGATLPPAGPDRRLRWDLAALYGSLDEGRRHRGLSWAQLAAELRCSPHQLTGIRRAHYAIGMRLAMRIVQWLGQPAGAFIRVAAW
jgi:hypothetical protein